MHDLSEEEIDDDQATASGGSRQMRDGHTARRVAREEADPQRLFDIMMREVFFGSENGDYREMVKTIRHRLERDPNLMAGNQWRLIERGILSLLHDLRSHGVRSIKKNTRGSGADTRAAASGPRYTVEQTIQTGETLRPVTMRNWMVSFGADAIRIIHFNKAQLVAYASDCRRHAAGYLKNAEFCEALARRLDDEQIVEQVWTEAELASLFDSVSAAVQRQSEEAA